MNLNRPSDSNEIILEADELHLWCTSLDPEGDHLKALRELLSDDERERAARFKFWRDQRRYMVGRGILRLLIGRYLSVDPQSIEFHYNEFGKPYLPAEDLKFNLAHCRDLILYGFCLNADVGVDLECIRPIVDAPGIASRFFSQGENKVLLDTPEEQRTELFLSYWTLKEAYIKAVGQGLSYPLDKFEVSLPETEAPSIFTSHDKIGDTIWSLFSLSPESGCVAAVAARGKNWRLIHCEFDW